MSVKAIDLRRGMGVEYKGGPWICMSNEKIAKGKGRSYQSIQLRNAMTGQLIEERFRTQDEFEQVMFERKQMEYLYSDGAHHVLMDPKSYEQFDLPADLLGEKSVYLHPTIHIEVSFVSGTAVTAELPNTVELKVVDTPPELKGATATNQLKDAVCEGGARVKVPPFITNGTVVKIDTRTGEYLSRA